MDGVQFESQILLGTSKNQFYAFMLMHVYMQCMHAAPLISVIYKFADQPPTPTLPGSQKISIDQRWTIRFHPDGRYLVMYHIFEKTASNFIIPKNL